MSQPTYEQPPTHPQQPVHDPQPAYGPQAAYQPQSAYPLRDTVDPGLQARPPGLDLAAIDTRVQVVERMRELAGYFIINAWEKRYSQPLAPHCAAYLYARPDLRRDGFWQIAAAWNLWLDFPQTRSLYQLLARLHQHFAPRAAGAGFDIRQELRSGIDRHMRLGSPEWVYIGLGVISLDTETGTWEQAQQTVTEPGEICAVIRTLLTDGTVIVCQQHERTRFRSFTVESSGSLAHAVSRNLHWLHVDDERLRGKDFDPEALRWAAELSDTISQADNRRLDTLRQASQAARDAHRRHRQ